MDITRTKRDIEDYCILSKVNSEHQACPHLIPQGQAPRFPDGCLKISGSPRYFPYDWVDHSGRVHPKSRGRQVTHPSISPAQ